MAQSNILLNIKTQIKKELVRVKIYMQNFKPLFLPVFLIFLCIPILYLLLFFKKEHSFYQNVLSTLKKIHLSEIQIHAKSARQQLNTISQSLININPLAEEKKMLLSLAEHLPENIYQKMISFFNENQLILQQKNIEHHKASKEILYSLQKPIFIHTDEVEKLITLIESNPNISFEKFILEKEKQTKNRLKLDFNLKIVVPNE